MCCGMLLCISQPGAKECRIECICRRIGKIVQKATDPDHTEMSGDRWYGALHNAEPFKEEAAIA